MDSGELCVMIHLVKMMLTLFADNLGTIVQMISITFQCKYSAYFDNSIDID